MPCENCAIQYFLEHNCVQSFVCYLWLLLGYNGKAQSMHRYSLACRALGYIGTLLLLMKAVEGKGQDIISNSQKLVTLFYIYCEVMRQPGLAFGSYIPKTKYI